MAAITELERRLHDEVKKFKFNLSKDNRDRREKLEVTYEKLSKLVMYIFK